MYQLSDYLNNPVKLAALCIWREARGCNFGAKCGVMWVLRNRAAIAPREGFKKNITDNILKPWAFSSFNPADPNSTKFPSDTDPSWKESFSAAQCPAPDPTFGAVFYYSKPLTKPPSAWGNVTHTVDIDGLHFYKL